MGKKTNQRVWESSKRSCARSAMQRICPNVSAESIRLGYLSACGEMGRPREGWGRRTISKNGAAGYWAVVDIEKLPEAEQSDCPTKTKKVLLFYSLTFGACEVIPQEFVWREEVCQLNGNLVYRGNLYKYRELSGGDRGLVWQKELF